MLLQKSSGDGALKALGVSEDLRLDKLLDGDPEFDSSLESTQEFLSKQGLQCLAN